MTVLKLEKKTHTKTRAPARTHTHTHFVQIQVFNFLLVERLCDSFLLRKSKIIMKRNNCHEKYFFYQKRIVSRLLWCLLLE